MPSNDRTLAGAALFRLCSLDPRCQFVSYVGAQCQWGAGCAFAPGGGQAFARAASRVPGAGWYWAAADLDPGSQAALAADESSVILLHPPLPLVGVSIVVERERQQNDSLVNG